MKPISSILSKARAFGTTRVHLRLIVIIPLILMILVLGFGLMYIWVINAFIASGAVVVDARYMDRAFELLKYQIVGSVALAGFIGVLLAYGIVLPVRQIMVGAARVASGDLTHTVRIGEGDELGRLGRAFNEMLLSLNRQILDGMSGGTVILNLERRVVALNHSAEMLLHIEADRLIGQPIADVIPQNAENHKFHQLLQDVLAGRLDGVRNVEIVAWKDSRLELTMKTTLLKSREDTVLGVLINFRESKSFLEEMRQRAMDERLRSLGRLSAGFAHELRNPLGSIKGFTQLLLEDFGKDDPRRAHVAIMDKEIDRLEGLVQRLLKLAHAPSDPSRFSRVAVNELVEQVLVLADYNSMSDTIRVVRRYADGLPLLMGDAAELKQAFLNIILNAFHAMRTGGELSIATRFDERTQQVEIVFADSGPGIPAEHRERIFDPFFTTREDGTGLGLFITQQVITMHHGRVQLQDSPLGGAQFLVSIPV